MIDNVTGKATRVDFRPVQLETMLAHHRERRLLGGYLVQQLIEAAKRLWPEFQIPDEPRTPLVGYPIVPRRIEDRASDEPFIPRWRKWISQVDDEDGGV
jgi:hypothetical protein